jgi:LytS/YehU family sensor histidine kinase
VREGEGERAVDMIAELSDLLRRALGAADRQEVTLDEELDFLDHYVRIQQVRFGNRLQVCYRIEPGIRSVLIPSLILQPLVENAIRHGLERTTRAVEVTIGASAIDERVLIDVSDTGPGPAGSPVLERVGLGTTRQRLAQLYGSEQSFTLEPREGGGTIVRLKLPLHMQVPKE